MVFDPELWKADVSNCKTDPFTPTGRGSVASPFFNAEQAYEQENVVLYYFCPECLCSPSEEPCLCGILWRDSRMDHAHYWSKMPQSVIAKRQYLRSRKLTRSILEEGD